jgi:hypothetical protein
MIPLSPHGFPSARGATRSVGFLPKLAAFNRESSAGAIGISLW